MKLIQRILKFLNKNVFNPKWTCNVCGKEIFDGEYFCEDCIKKFPFNDGFICEHCGRPTASPEEYCLTCKDNLTNIDKGRSVYSYEGKIKTLVKKMKFFENAYLTKIFAKELSVIYFKNLFTSDFVVYVPMTSKKEKKNGYNHGKALAEAFANEVGLQTIDVLEKTKETKKQALLNAEERRKNLKGSFRVTDKKQIKDKKIILIDDVTTTGSTAETIAELLKKSGAKTVTVLTVASVKSKQSI